MSFPFFKVNGKSDQAHGRICGQGSGCHPWELKITADLTLLNTMQDEAAQAFPGREGWGKTIRGLTSLHDG